MVAKLNPRYISLIGIVPNQGACRFPTVGGSSQKIADHNDGQFVKVRGWPSEGVVAGWVRTARLLLDRLPCSASRADLGDLGLFRRCMAPRDGPARSAPPGPPGAARASAQAVPAPPAL